MNRNSDNGDVAWDVIVIGAGAAGLAAAHELSRNGARTLVIEARNRLGGRIFTVHDPDYPVPLELGAEFIHGMPETTLSLAQAARLAFHEVPDEHCYSAPMRSPVEAQAGGMEIVPMPHFWEDLQLVLKKMAPPDTPDRPFARFLASAERDPELKRFVPLVRAYVEGFHGADPRHISEKALAEAESELSEPEGREVARLTSGYDGIIQWLAEGVRSLGGEIRLNTIVQEVIWTRQSVELKVLSRAGMELPSIRARKLVITLPLSLLQASIHGSAIEGAIRFSPSIREKERAVDHLRMGPVMKVILGFRSRFWEKHPTDARLIHLDPARISFLHHPPTRDVVFPTWWTLRPFRVPVLVGWTGGPRALELANQPRETMIAEAVRSLSLAFGFSQPTIEEQLDSWHYHDWTADPYARGAYSYVGVHGSQAQRELSHPLAQTLFFAGEATHFGGQSGTVDGAIDTGNRAAREVLQALSSARVA